MGETITERRASTAVTFANLADLIPGKVGSTTGVGILEHIRDVVDANLIRAYGSMSVQGASSAEGTTDGTPRKLTAWTNDDLELNMTADKTTGNDITADVAGTFLVSCGVSFSGTGNKTFVVEIYKNGSATGFAADRKLGAGGDVGRVAIVGIVALAATDTLELYQWSGDGGSSLTVTEAVMAAFRIAP